MVSASRFSTVYRWFIMVKSFMAVSFREKFSHSIAQAGGFVKGFAKKNLHFAL